MADSPLNITKRNLGPLPWPSQAAPPMPNKDLKPLHPEQITGKLHPGPISVKQGLPLQQTGKNQDPKEIKKAAQMMEGFFLQMLLKEMDKTVVKSGFLDGGFAEDIFKSMLHEKMGDELAKAGGVGLAEIIQAQLTPRVNKTPVNYSFTKVRPSEAEKVKDAPE